MTRLLVLALAVCLSPGDESDRSASAAPASKRAPLEPVATPYEVLRPEASWCGPRVLYFFAWYLGKECTLEDVCRLCETDSQGHTSLLNLVEAARALDLEPTAIACSTAELQNLRGPAILCVRRAKQSGDPAHFIGLLGQEEDYFHIVDPAVSTQPFGVRKDSLTRAFLGQVVLLKGCPIPPLRPWWLSFPGVFAPAALALGFAAGVVALRRRLERRALAKAG